MAKPNTQIHLGKRVSYHLSHLDRVIAARGLTRSQAMNILIEHVLKNRLLADILDKEGALVAEEALYSIAPAKPEPLQSLLGESVNMYEPDATLEPATDAPRDPDLPEPSRVATSAPRHSFGTPRYFTTRGNITPRRYVEKTKDALREEIRRAVENTR